MSSTTNVSRRQFIKIGTSAACAYGLLGGPLGAPAARAASNTAGYKAIVCLYLYGGNNSFNWIVPTSATQYAQYAKARSNLALANNSLLPLNGQASDGASYGIHPSCPEMQSLFNQGHLAVISNVGTLVQPVTPAQARSGAVPLPGQLFSHIDQSTGWMVSIAGSPERYGWAGRVADLLTSQGGSPKIAYNINIGGSNYWQAGKLTTPYTLGTSGAATLNVSSNTSYRNGSRAAAEQALMSQAQADANPMIQEYAAIQNNAASKVNIINNAFTAAGGINTPFPAYAADTGIGAQLKEVAQTIKAQSQLGDARQFFFVQMAGFDTHNGELATQQNLLGILSKNLAAFWAALGEIGMQSNVMLFTASDFGRSLGSNGDGSDHAWGGHAVVMGGAVKGGQYYGKMPSLVIGGADDFQNGRIVPTTSTDQYAATLCSWFGVSDSDLDMVFPNLKNFSNRNLGFTA